MKKTTKTLLTILCVVFICVFAFSGYKLYSIIHEYKVSERMYNGLSGQFVSKGDNDRPTLDKPKEEEQGPTEISPITVDFDALLNTSSDVIGWLYSADTVINYPVVQAEDNFFYLYRFIDGTYNGGGSLFMDCTNYSDFSGKHSVIYGHHMNDGSMLASICNYRKQEYYDAHPVLYLNTPTQNYRVEPFSGFVTAADSAAYTMDFANDAEYSAFLEKMKGFSDFDCDVEMTAEDRMITLSTCTYEYDNARFVLMCKLIPIG